MKILHYDKVKIKVQLYVINFEIKYQYFHLYAQI